MSRKDVWKVLVLLSIAVVVVGLYCYARVDLGMSLEQVNAKFDSCLHSLWGIAALVLVVILTPWIAKPFIDGVFERAASRQAEHRD